MSATVDESGRLLDPEAEVRKLQELVAQLTAERNLYLNKSKENSVKTVSDADNNSLSVSLSEHELLQQQQQHQQANSNISTSTISQSSLDNEGLILDKQLDSNQQSKAHGHRDDILSASLEDVELLDADCIDSVEEEDSWLYTSPKKLSATQENVSPYKWVREEFESPELESARHCLIFRLDELSKSQSSQSNNNSDHASNKNGSSTNVSSAGSMPHIRQPLLNLGSRVDTNTFTRPKKSRSNTVTIDNSIHQQLVSSSSDTPSSRDSAEKNNNALAYRVDENANGQSGASSGSQESLGPTHRLADVMDVQVVAKMQEESLRQSLNAPRKSLSQSLNQSASSGLLDILDPGSGSSNRSSPGRFDSDMYQSVKRSNNSLASLSSNSTSSPPASPHGSQYFDARAQAVWSHEGHRSSLPNLTRSYPGGTSGMPSHSSDPRLREQSSPSPTGMLSQSRLQAPSKLQKGAAPRSSNSRQLRSLAARSSGSPARMLSPNRQESPKRMSPQRAASPQNTQHAYANQGAHYDRSASPGRALSPQRNASRGRGLSPQRTVSSSERLSPQKQGSPGRALSPHRNTSPRGTLSPQRNASPGRTLSPQRNASPGRALSPQRSGIPTSARTGIPRPASYSKLPTPRRSSIPSRRTSLATPKSGDDSWKDGCF